MTRKVECIPIFSVPSTPVAVCLDDETPYPLTTPFEKKHHGSPCVPDGIQQQPFACEEQWA
jgi:hypothetical protein